MLRVKKYDEKTKTEEAWYDSSMFVYTKMVENEDDNCGQLYVTFKNGMIYQYKDVKFEDYVLLIAGGTDASQGKTLNKFIKTKYEYAKVGENNVDELNERAEKLILEERQREQVITNTYFISGYEDILPEEFEMRYQDAIAYTLNEYQGSRFIVGDRDGCDGMAQNYIINVLLIDPSRVTVYHTGDVPKNLNPKITNTVGGFDNYWSMDEAMTKSSSFDIAFVRDEKESSNVTANILRRYKFQ